MARPTREQIIAIGVLLLVAGWVLGVAFLTPTGTIRSATVVETVSDEGDRPSYERMMSLVENGEVKIAYWYDFSLLLETRSGEKFRFEQTVTQVLTDVFKGLRAQGVEVIFGAPPSDSALAPSPSERIVASFWETLGFVVAFLPMVILVAMLFFLRGTMGGRTQGGRWPLVLRKHPTTFADVAGHEETRYELEELKTFIQRPEAYTPLGARAPRGVLMVGPPGTGKTLMAKALAGECGAAFIPVSGSDFGSMFANVGKGKVRKLFEIARRNAPCIVFIDEIDSLARARGADSSAVTADRDSMLNQLLVMMDGFEPNDGVFVVGATNRVDVLDSALLRPGRFDRQIHVGLPDRRGREKILEIHVRDKPLADDVDLASVARSTPGFSGADLANLANEAAVHAARDGHAVVSANDFSTARDKVILGVERRSAVLDEKERRLVAFHEAGHAVAACFTDESDPVHQATIIPRGKSLGAVMRLPERDLLCHPKAKLEADLVVMMAGRAAESIVFGADKVTTGAESDIDYATNIATRMVAQWGMSSMGMRRIAVRSDGSLPAEAEQAIGSMLDTAYAKAEKLLTVKRKQLDAIAEALLERETMTGDEVRAILFDDKDLGDDDVTIEIAAE